MKTLGIQGETEYTPVGIVFKPNDYGRQSVSDLDLPIGQLEEQAYAHLRDAFALVGFALHRTHPNDGPVTYWAGRVGSIYLLPTLHAAKRFLEAFGGRL